MVSGELVAELVGLSAVTVTVGAFVVCELLRGIDVYGSCCTDD